MKADLERYESYLEHKHPNRSTKKHYASDLNIFIQIVGNKSARELTVKDIDAFIKEQSQQQLKPVTQLELFELDGSQWQKILRRTEYAKRRTAQKAAAKQLSFALNQLLWLFF